MTPSVRNYHLIPIPDKSQWNLRVLHRTEKWCNGKKDVFFTEYYNGEKCILRKYETFDQLRLINDIGPQGKGPYRLIGVVLRSGFLGDLYK